MLLNDLKDIIVEYKYAISRLNVLKSNNLVRSQEYADEVKDLKVIIDRCYKVIVKNKDYLTVRAKKLEDHLQREFASIYPDDQISLYYTENIQTVSQPTSTNSGIEEEYYHRLMMSRSNDSKYRAITLSASKEFSPLSDKKLTLQEYVNIADIIRIELTNEDRLINSACWKLVDIAMKTKFLEKDDDDRVYLI